MEGIREWNDESGDWRGLANDEQRPRYEGIAAEIERLNAGSVLDVGCGEAIMRNFMPAGVTRYVGVEPSMKALAAAQSRQVTVVHATAEHFEPDTLWECILFNEVLYYAADPIGLLQKYAKALTPTGVFIVSILQRPGRPSLKMFVRHCLNRRRPISNIHCTKMVLRFAKIKGWTVHTEVIPSAKGDHRWHVLVIRPTH